MDEFNANDIYFVVASQEIKYISAVCYPDILEITQKIHEIKNNKITLEYVFINFKTRKCTTLAKATMVFLNGKTNKVISVPKDFKKEYEDDCKQ